MKLEPLTSAELAVLRAALPILQKIVGSASVAEPGEDPIDLPRTDDGRHLSEEGIRILYEFFENGGTPYGAMRRFGIHYGPARERHRKWRLTWQEAQA